MARVTDMENQVRTSILVIMDIKLYSPPITMKAVQIPIQLVWFQTKWVCICPEYFTPDGDEHDKFVLQQFELGVQLQRKC